MRQKKPKQGSRFWVGEVQTGTLRHSMRECLLALSVRGYSEMALGGWVSELRAFADWAEERGLSRPEDIGRSILEGYQRHLFYKRKSNGAALSFSTQRHRLQVLRTYFRYLVRQRLLEANPAAELELPRALRVLPRSILSVAQMEAILAQPDTGTAVGLRDRALMEVFYSTGMRRSELAGLKMAAVHKEKGVVFIVQGKGRKDRVVPIGERALHWLLRYGDEVRPQWAFGEGVVGGPLFLTEAGEAIRPESLTRTVGFYVKQANLGVQGSCHLFRHAAATHMLEGGADVRFVQEMLGHASLETTQRYAHVSITKLKGVHQATHPGALLAASGLSKENASEDTLTSAQLLASLDEEANEAPEGAP